jgi:hypothetical protein
MCVKSAGGKRFQAWLDPGAQELLPGIDPLCFRVLSSSGASNFLLCLPETAGLVPPSSSSIPAEEAQGRQVTRLPLSYIHSATGG